MGPKSLGIRYTVLSTLDQSGVRVSYAEKYILVCEPFDIMNHAIYRFIPLISCHGN